MIICLLLYGFLFLTSLYFDKKIYSPRVLFFGVWTLIFLFYLLRIYPLKDYSVLALFVYVLSGICFFAGSLFPSIKNIKNKRTVNMINSKTKKIIFIVFVLITYIVLIRGSIGQVKAILNGSTYYELSINGDENINETRGIWVPLTYFIAGPIAYAISPISAYEVICEKKWKYILINLSIVALFVLTRGERGLIFMFLSSYLVMFLINKDHNKNQFLTKKEKHKNIITVLLMAISFVTGIVAINYFSISRGITEQGESWYYYLTGTIPYLSIMLNNAQNYMFGLAMLNGLLTPVLTLLNGLGILSWPNWYIESQNICSTATFYNISSSGSFGFNAFVGPAYYNYLDFGLLGVIVGMVIFGYVCNIVYVNSQRKFNGINVCLYLMLAFNLIFSMERNWFFMSYYIYAFIYICFFLRNQNTAKEVSHVTNV